MFITKDARQIRTDRCGKVVGGGHSWRDYPRRKGYEPLYVSGPDLYMKNTYCIDSSA